jgi:hypothetical protein
VKVIQILVAVVAALTVQTASAWGYEGHRLVAQLAEPQLTPAAHRELQRLLALEPGATLASISTWADEHRSPVTASWHFVNLGRGDCRYDSDRHCLGGRCVVAAIEAQREVLMSSEDDERRLQALRYVVHLVADVHQPLHAGFFADKGGNTFQVHVFGRGSNLHKLWDSGLIEHCDGGAARLFEELYERPVRVKVSAPASWAEESCRIVETDGFYPSGHKISEDYARRWDGVLRQRLSLAGARLTQLLNDALPRRSKPSAPTLHSH